MKFLGKTLIFIALLAGITAQGADIERKEKVAKESQEVLDAALYPAMEAGDVEAVKKLLAQGANPNNKDVKLKGESQNRVAVTVCKPALVYALNASKIGSPMQNLPINPAVVQVLLEGKADMSTAPLWFYNHLVRRIANPDRIPCVGGVAGHYKCLELLLEHKCDVNISYEVQYEGTMPLIIHAAKLNLPDVVALCLKHNANLGKKDSNGKTFFDYADDKPTILAVYQQLRKQRDEKILADEIFKDKETVDLIVEDL